ncbi:DUF6207 family protein [Streptomyces sp. NPDC087843]|uniref:DUF6207 family protein n=1 Tax=Streptomyces sp. NPDC087843 TaxID=3365804 RepID=UPI00380ED3C6
MWAATSVERTTRDPGQPGVRLSSYLAVGQRPPASPAAQRKARGLIVEAWDSVCRVG